MGLPTKSFDELNSDQANAMQGVSSVVLDFNTGSDWLALIESNSGLALWLQSLATYLLGVARLQTSHGQDVDTFVQQFGLTRLPPTPASAADGATFSRFTATQQAVIPSGLYDPSTNTITPGGAVVSAATNGISYMVYADTDNLYYDPLQNSYVIPVNITSISVPIVALTPGAIGNVISNEITTINSSLIYIDNVTNTQPITNGQDAESDSALRVRFVLYLDSLSKATKQALAAATLAVTGVKRYELVENKDIAGNEQLGFFIDVIDDGTGSASSGLLQAVSNNLEVTRGFTIGFSVYAPIQFPIDITVHVFIPITVDPPTIQAEVVAALENYITGQTFEALFAWSDIARVVYEADPVIINVTNWTLNGGTSDITLATQNIAVVGTITVIMNA